MVPSGWRAWVSDLMICRSMKLLIFWRICWWSPERWEDSDLIQIRSHTLCTSYCMLHTVSYWCHVLDMNKHWSECNIVHITDLPNCKWCIANCTVYAEHFDPCGDWTFALNNCTLYVEHFAPCGHFEIRSCTHSTADQIPITILAANSTRPTNGKHKRSLEESQWHWCQIGAMWNEISGAQAGVDIKPNSNTLRSKKSIRGVELSTGAYGKRGTLGSSVGFFLRPQQQV